MALIVQWSLAILLWAASGFCQECVHYFRSDTTGPTGVFQSTNFPSRYGNGIRCQYRFIGRSYERIQINFTSFQLNGYFQECDEDYIDVYPAIKRPDYNILSTQLHGRYCGMDKDLIPYLFMSTHSTLAFVFITNMDDRTGRGFQGHFTFVNSSDFLASPGIAAKSGICGWNINSEEKKAGTIMSPDYPAVYLDDRNCFYILRGKPGERIKLTFTDFDLFYGGSHCPFDKVVIHDGGNTDAPQITAKCGTLEPFTVFSSTSQLYVGFITRSGRLYPPGYWDQSISERTQMRGFKATYSFSSEFVDLAVLPQHSEHVRGTECDSRVFSRGLTNGTIYSPGYPRNFPQGARCIYYLIGMEHEGAREKVALQFKDFDVPQNSPGCSRNGFLSVYYYGQDPTKDSPDSKFCNERKPPQDEYMVSRGGHKLALVLDTKNAIPGRGFRAQYHFIVDYKIQGTRVTSSTDLFASECHFRYSSSAAIKGTINTPRWPSHYPDDITCKYELLVKRGEVVIISFDRFEIRGSEDGYGSQCSGDYLESKSVLPKGQVSYGGQVCGSLYPGPIISEWGANALVLLFKSDDNLTAPGFTAKYEFVNMTSRFGGGGCGGNISATEPGLLETPNFPLKYQIKTICDWYIYANLPRGRIQIVFKEFDIEGRQSNGCQGAVLRVYSGTSENDITHELCGSNADLHPIISEGGFIRLKFLSSSKSLGKRGFRISYNEMSAPLEPAAGSRTDPLILVYVIAAVAAVFVLILLISICLCIHFSRKSRKKKEAKAYAMTSSRLGALTISTGPDSESLMNGPPLHQVMYASDSLPYEYHIGDSSTLMSAPSHHTYTPPMSTYQPGTGDSSTLMSAPSHHTYTPPMSTYQPGTGGAGGGGTAARHTWMSAGLDYDTNSCLTSL